VNVLRLTQLILTSIEYRFAKGTIKLPVDAKALPCSPLSSYLNGLGYVGHGVADFLFAYTWDWILLLAGRRSDFVNTIDFGPWD